MAAFDQARSALEAEGIEVVAASTDSAEKAAKTVDELGVRFPVGHSLPLSATARALTAFYEDRRGILHATGFLTRPDRTIAVACYSTAQIGRLVVEDVLASVRFSKRTASVGSAP